MLRRFVFSDCVGRAGVWVGHLNIVWIICSNLAAATEELLPLSHCCTKENPNQEILRKHHQLITLSLPAEMQCRKLGKYSPPCLLCCGVRHGSAGITSYWGAITELLWTGAGTPAPPYLPLVERRNCVLCTTWGWLSAVRFGADLHKQMHFLLSINTKELPVEVSSHSNSVKTTELSSRPGHFSQTLHSSLKYHKKVKAQPALFLIHCTQKPWAPLPNRGDQCFLAGAIIISDQ